MDNERKQLLMQIMAESFTAVELNLFLDTHPDDRKALSDYNETVNRLHQITMQYEQKYGPLTNFGHASSEHAWRWVEEPWPWEMNFV